MAAYACLDTPHPAWLLEKADRLIRELLERCAGIRLTRQPAVQEFHDFAEIFTEIDGTYAALLTFRAEYALLHRLAENMRGDLPAAPDDDEEYGKEFMNVVCGRLVSDIFRLTRSPARFYPPRFVRGACPLEMQAGDYTSVLSYRSDADDCAAELRWMSCGEMPALQIPFEGRKIK